MRPFHTLKHTNMLVMNFLTLLPLITPCFGSSKPDACFKPPASFVHCPRTSKNYKSLLLAVHGWNGDCHGTFGKGDQSVFGVLDDKNFYDYDCFSYDSTDTPIQENTAALRAHLAQLSKEGYEEVVLITHSTGGILALQLLTDLFLDENGAPRQDLPAGLQGKNELRIVAVQAWGTPINGLRTEVNWGGRVLRVLGFSPETLPDLDPGSDYLKDLKQRLRTLYDLRKDKNYTWIRDATQVNVTFHQGQGEDQVVKSINPVTAKEEKWIWPDRWTFSNTDMGHTHSLSESGDAVHIGEPRFPALITDKESLLALKCRPRFKEVFPENITGVVPKSLEDRQKEVIQGMIHYGYFGPQEFISAFEGASMLFERIFAVNCVRSSAVDKTFILGYLGLVEERFSNPSEHLVSYFIKTIPKTLEKYDPTGAENKCVAGFNHADTSQALLKTIALIHRKVVQYIEDHPDDETDLLSGKFASLEEFDTRMITLICRFLESKQGPVLHTTLNLLPQAIHISSKESVEKAGALEKLNVFYRNHISALSLEAKNMVSNSFGELIAKGGETRTAMLASMNENVGVQLKPMWTSLASDRSVKMLLDQTRLGGLGDPEAVKFLGGIINQAGASGNNLELALQTVDILQATIVEGGANPEYRTWLMETETPVPKYPLVAREFRKTLAKLPKTNLSD